MHQLSRELNGGSIGTNCCWPDVCALRRGCPLKHPTESWSSPPLPPWPKTSVLTVVLATRGGGGGGGGVQPHDPKRLGTVRVFAAPPGHFGTPGPWTAANERQLAVATTLGEPRWPFFTRQLQELTTRLLFLAPPCRTDLSGRAITRICVAFRDPAPLLRKHGLV